ncbi:hypothetical protein JAAARDRAFT_117547 [Jaapia argillacea MUCL 33604]|uniref:HMA domain-containing protein n=1 Tax=Jaapia argillacea MUCL 33604 TaxID=933084 RepID=A0A067QPD2_9AGAM|nr:hypothetical protein JAAARDRAFT_117547 [Jaapia argillacea MUCL 33604]
MTCASCSNTITDLVSQIPGVTDLVVNVLGKSATATVEHKKLVADIITTIEDAGYEAEAVALQPIDTETDTLAEPGPRTISLRVDGMFCKHCPDKVMTALAQFGSQIEVHKPIETYTDPILQLTYQPAPPSFTIRTIISTVANAKSPPFVVSIHRPATLEEKARNMQIREQRGLLLRLAFAVIAAIPTFIIGIVYMTLVHDGNPTKAFFMEPMWTGNTSRAEWALFFLSTPVMFYSAGLFHRRSLKEIRALWRPGSRTPVWKRFIRFGSMNLLVSAGVSVAYFASIALLALASTQPRSPAGNGDTTTYFDSVVFLTMFLLSGRYLEAYSKSRTADAITALGKLRPTEALLLVDSAFTPREPQYSESGDLEKGDPVAEKLNENGFKTERVDVSLLEMGDVVRVPSGSTPPADGIILRGDSGAFDESSLTGESRLIKKEVGDRVFLGTINKGSMVDVRVDTVGGETMLDHIMKVVREGQTRRAPIERVADILTGYFVPIITLLAISTWIIWLGLGEGGALPSDYLDIEVGGWLVWSLEFAIAVFVVACPCGIGLAAPTALLVGSGLAAKFGILARGGGEAFQEAAQLDVVVFDKTGTLTTGGEPQVTDAEIQSLDDKWKREVILGIAAEIESASSHPLASAIRRYCEANGAVPTSGSAFEETAGKGLKATFESSRCAAIIGNEAWMRDHGAAVTSEMMDSMEQWKSEAKSVVLMAIQQHDGPTPESTPYRVVAIFAVADEIRPEARDVIDRLQAQGLGTWMISGDNATTAKAVAKLVGIPESNVIAGVLPHEKAEKIQWLQQVGMKRKESKWRGLFGKQRLNERCIVAMVGDGINDAPALTVADVSIAIGSGSDVAVTSASFILVSSNLRSLLTLVDLSRKVFNRVKFNFVWAVMYNLAALPIAAGVVYPAGHARLSPVWASLAMALSSVSVVCSSLLLKLYKEPRIIPA